MKTRSKTMEVIRIMLVSIMIIAILVLMGLMDALSSPEIFRSEQPILPTAENENLGEIYDDLFVQAESLNSWIRLANENPPLILSENWRENTLTRMEMIENDFEQLMDENVLFSAAKEKFEVGQKLMISGFENDDHGKIFEAGNSFIEMNGYLKDLKNELKY